MKRFFKLMLALTLAATCVLPLAACENKKPEATIKLADGREINLVLYRKYAPETVENFIRLAKEGYYDGLCLSDVTSSKIMAGDYEIDDRGADSYTVKETESRPTIYGEFYNNGYIVQNLPLKHVLGTISMWRDSDVKDSASTTFFLCATDISDYDKNYAAFGECKDEASRKVITDIVAAETFTYDPDDDTTLHLPSEPVIIETIVIKD